MSANEVDLQPDSDEVLQTEGADGPEPEVRTQALPTKAGATFSKTVGTGGLRDGGGQLVPILRADPRRASATLICKTQSMLIAYDAASAGEATTMAEWPVGVPFRLSVRTDVYVAASTATTTISVLTELWATGESD
jgi:hypothetical protein